ncbi:cytochrome P450 [Albimonas pacifica]|uniref:Cytochrome P450 n=1 Tax=Albimonas pacifica TaxID=1114924 RepID=A0A1I3D189_9RHOB|nr:cytochrome P450 [Albimonas pacifica]SFH80299.1 Cytochrome P450 [Albimonas pacifica]
MRPDDLPRFRQSPTDPAFMADPYPAYERLRALGPVAFWEELGKPVLCGHAEVSAALRDRRFGREVTHLASREALGWDPIPERLAPFYAFEAHSLLEREPPVHTRLRKLVNRAFTSRAVAGLGPWIEGLAESLIDEFEPETELMERFATPIPLTVIADLLGAPVEAGPQMLEWSHDMVGMYQAGRDRAAEDRAVAATEAFSAFMRELIAQRRRRPGEALIDALIAAEDPSAEGGARLSEPELVTTCILLLNAGHEATVHAIGNAVRLVVEGGLDRAAFGRAGGERAVDECLRLDPPLHLFSRYALGEVEVAGLRLKLGEEVGLLLAAANRDPDVFADPARADFAREGADRHVSLGAGLHFCVGAPLARLEMRAALAVLFRRWPELRLAGPPRRSGRWHFHGHEALRIAS